MDLNEKLVEDFCREAELLKVGDTHATNPRAARSLIRALPSCALCRRCVIRTSLVSLVFALRLPHLQSSPNYALNTPYLMNLSAGDREKRPESGLLSLRSLAQ